MQTASTQQCKTPPVAAGDMQPTQRHTHLQLGLCLLQLQLQLLLQHLLSRMQLRILLRNRGRNSYLQDKQGRVFKDGKQPPDQQHSGKEAHTTTVNL
jgi:hypothetical protein